MTRPLVLEALKQIHCLDLYKFCSLVGWNMFRKLFHSSIVLNHKNFVRDVSQLK
jgi:hypothetical protein